MSDLNGQNPASSNMGPQFAVHNIYVKDVSYEAPNTPQIFTLEWQPKVDFDLQMASQIVGEHLYEVVLHVTVTVKLGEDKTAFLIDLKQSGIFLAKGFEEEALQLLLSTTCPSILFPYAREAISSMVTRGGFPQFILPPVNFDALYKRHLEEQRQTQGETL